MRKRKITVTIDEMTCRYAGQLASEKGLGFREYLTKVLEKGAETGAGIEKVPEMCEVTLEISEETMADLEYVAEAYHVTPEIAAREILSTRVFDEWGNRT